MHKGEEAWGEREGGMSSASHLDCQTLAVRLGIFQREPEITCLTSTLPFPSLYLAFSPLFSFILHISSNLLPRGHVCVHTFGGTSEEEGAPVFVCICVCDEGRWSGVVLGGGVEQSAREVE